MVIFIDSIFDKIWIKMFMSTSKHTLLSILQKLKYIYVYKCICILVYFSSLDRSPAENI